MTFEDVFYSECGVDALSWKEKFISRRMYWPELDVKANSFGAKPDSWVIGGESNFWKIGEQYYLLAWTLFTLGNREQMDLPYKGNLSNDTDIAHQEILKGKIFQNGWNFIQILGNAHLACEMAFKSMALHLSADVSSAKFPKTHDLKEILMHLPENANRELKDDFNSWAEENSSSENFSRIIKNSGSRFISQRYNHPAILNSATCGTIGLSRFIYEICFGA